jgi:hypothetical protein
LEEWAPEASYRVEKEMEEAGLGGDTPIKEVVDRPKYQALPMVQTRPA